MPAITITIGIQLAMRKSLKPITARVYAGISMSMSSNVCIKPGSTPTSITIITTIATIIRIIGYIMAFFTSPLSLFSFSKCTAILDRDFSSEPDCSPAATMLRSISGNISPCLRIAIESVSPFSTLAFVSTIACASFLFSVCCESMSSASITLTPAFNILLNWRQNTERSLTEAFFLPIFISISLLRRDASLMDTTMLASAFKAALALSKLSASMFPFFFLPSFVTISYEYVAIMYNLAYILHSCNYIHNLFTTYYSNSYWFCP